MSTPTPALHLRGIWKIFGEGANSFLKPSDTHPTDADLNRAGLIAAVRDANLDIQHGEIFVIMGLSGSGKSTLVRCMSRLIEPTAGEILFDGQNLLAISEKELIEMRRHKMGMVFQHFALLPHLSVLGNVAFPLEIQGVDRGAREQRARDMIELVGLSGREDYYPRELSGGQQQRVGIARSLAVEPEIWFLDEPFSALDPLIRREMQDEFLRLQGLLHKTIVFITHDFDEAIRLADRIAIMKDGAIIQTGAPEDLILNPATDYVAEFTRDVSRSKVLSARMVMRPVVPGEHLDETLAYSTKVQDLADRIVHTERQIGVIDDDGSIIGVVDRQSVLDVLVGNEPPRAD
ncbi:MAG: ABC transporter ATP-binding protein [Acidiferrobacteraceae bacterium]|nr:ABC transporter ATP-binding protein [Acidiferrobacteraceae bacterium]HJP08238.1 betaine/proline/choline family ABC transporter ATP-binding protein [Arenicellales bacterium]